MTATIEMLLAFHSCPLIYDSALFYYRLSLPVSDTLDTRMNKITAYNEMATVFKEQHNIDSAKWYAQKVLFETGKNIAPAGKQKAAELLADIYEQQHNPDSSLKYLHRDRDNGFAKPLPFIFYYDRFDRGIYC